MQKSEQQPANIGELYEALGHGVSEHSQREGNTFYVPSRKSEVRPFSAIHDELMINNPEYRTAWLNEHRKGDNLGFLHHSFMTNTEFYDAYESKAEFRKACLIRQLITWREGAGLSVQTVADRMGVEAKTVSRIERSPLNATINSIARYAHACGIKVSLEKI